MCIKMGTSGLFVAREILFTCLVLGGGMLR